MTRAELEDFLFHEAALLDEARLAEWIALWIDGGPGYVIPTADAEHGDPRTSLAYVADDLDLLRTRVAQLQQGTTVAEIPRTRTSRIVGNVRILDGVHAGDFGDSDARDTDARDARPDGKSRHLAVDMRVASRFLIHAVRHDRGEVLSGRYEHLLTHTPEGIRILGKRVVLTHESIPIGRLSFLL